MRHHTWQLLPEDQYPTKTLLCRNLRAELAEGVDLHSVDGGDDVSGLDAGLICGGSLHDLVDKGALLALVVKGLGDLRAELSAHDTEEAAVNLAELDDLAGKVLQHVRGDGEADSDIAAARGDDGGVHADELALEVHKRAARIAAVDGGISLDEVLEVLDIEAGASECAHNAVSDSLAEAERVADGKDEVADADLVGVSKRNCGKLLV